MESKIEYSKANLTDLKAISKLLEISQLPFSDINVSPIEFIVAKNNEKVIGSIGIERYKTEGLLRSFVVDPAFQNKGIGKELYNRLLKYTTKQQITSLHLLTTTAKDYFKKTGFKLTDKKDAPIEIRKSTEFSILCPDSSTYMVLELDR